MDDVMERVKATVAGRYRIVRELGAGGMATVYLASGSALSPAEVLALVAA